MKQEVFQYFQQRCQEEGISFVPGHNPDFTSNEDVDQWLALILKCLKPTTEKMTGSK